jgi:hypothetical protein
MKSGLLTILTILTFGSCTTSKYIFTSDRFQDIGQLTVDRAVKRDIDSRYKDVSPDHLIEIGESIYPNAQKFQLTTPKTFETTDDIFKLTTDYYFTADDSLVKVILYQWDKAKPVDGKKQFQRKFNQLRKLLTDNLGEPKEIDIQQKDFNDETFRDGIKWTGKVNSYLFMFGNDETEYRQIRLAIYGE